MSEVFPSQSLLSQVRHPKLWGSYKRANKIISHVQQHDKDYSSHYIIVPIILTVTFHTTWVPYLLLLIGKWSNNWTVEFQVQGQLDIALWDGYAPSLLHTTVYFTMFVLSILKMPGTKIKKQIPHILNGNCIIITVWHSNLYTKCKFHTRFMQDIFMTSFHIQACSGFRFGSQNDLSFTDPC